MHPLIVGELAMADYVHRKPLLENLLEMPMLRGATFQETLHFVSERKIDSLGIQWNDAILLASVIIAGNTLLWTRDRRLREIATQFGVAYSAE